MSAPPRSHDTQPAPLLAGSGRAPAAGQTVRPWLVLLLTAGLTFVVLVFLFPNLWYGVHKISDIPLYQWYADAIGNGLRPYLDFKIEYPPLAVPFFRLPGADIPLEIFMRRFSIEMGVVTLLTGLVVAVTACVLWPRGRRAYVAGAAFAAAVALTGAVIVNRYDVVVALMIAVFVLCLVRGWTIAAAVALGLGFALKITPVALLPLVLLLAGPPRRWVWPIVAFGAAGILGFLPYLVTAPAGVWHVFQYHIERPLQVESVLGTPLLIARLLGSQAVTVGQSHGTGSIIGPGSGMAADLSGFLTLAALAAVYLLLLQRNALRRAAPDQIPVAVLAMLLAILAFGKVLSPQYVIWIVPVLALVVVSDRLLGGLVALVLLLTHVEFPSLYIRLLLMESPVVALVAARNLLLLACFGFALWRLWQLPQKTAAPVLAPPRRALD